MMRSMVIDMNDEQVQTLAQMQAFLDGTVAIPNCTASPVVCTIGVYNPLSIVERLNEFARGDTRHAGADRPPTP